MLSINLTAEEGQCSVRQFFINIDHNPYTRIYELQEPMEMFIWNKVKTQTHALNLTIQYPEAGKEWGI